MDGVAEWIEDRGYIEIDFGSVMPDIGHGQGQVLGECSWAIDANALCIRAKMTATGHAIATTSTDDMSFAADNIAWFEVCDIIAYRYDFTDEFVSDYHWDGDRFPSPFVPLINVEISPADTGSVDVD